MDYKMSEADKNDIILRIIQELKTDKSLENKIDAIMIKLAALEEREKEREKEIVELQEYNKEMAKKKEEISRFNFNKAFIIIMAILGISSLAISIINIFI